MKDYEEKLQLVKTTSFTGKAVDSFVAIKLFIPFCDKVMI
jgi:hypothetical protein